MGVLMEKQEMHRKALSSYDSLITHTKLFNDAQLKTVLVFLSVVCIYFLQYRFRILDDNTLLSWRWITTEETFFKLLLPLVIGLVLVYKCCQMQVTETRAIAILVLTAFLISMFSWQTPEVIVDSARYFIHAKVINSEGLGYFLSAWGSDVNAWTDLPLISIVYGLMFSIFGESRMAIQLLNSGFFAATAVLTYLIGKNLWDAQLGIFAAFLLLAIPYLHIQTALMLVDVPAMFFLALAFWLTILALQKGNAGVIGLASISIVLAMLSKYSIWIAASVILLLPFAISGVAKPDLVKRLGILIFSSGSLMLVLGAVYYESVMDQFGLLFGFQWAGLSRWQESYVSTFLYQIHPIVSLLLLISLGLAVKTKDTKYFLIALPVLVFLLLGIERARYLIVLFPFIALLAAFGLRYFQDFVIKKYIVASAVYVSVLITVGLSIPFLASMGAANIKAAAKYIDSLHVNEVLVLVSEQERSSINPEISIPLLDYYTDTNIKHYFTDQKNNYKQSVSQTSPLRFTWQLKPFPYSKMEPNNNYSGTIVLITSNKIQSVSSEIKQKLKEYSLKRKFLLNDGVFRYQTVVKVFQKTAWE